jgi:hypothetical protein
MRSCNDISRKTAGTPLGAVGRGLAAGAVGTLAMDLLLYARYRRGGGKQHLFAWEFSSGLSSWDEAPVPGQVGKRLFEGLFQKKLPPQRAELVTELANLCSARASTSRPQPIGPAPVRSRRPSRSKPSISVRAKRTRVASTSWSGMRTASAARVPAATRGNSVTAWW